MMNQGKNSEANSSTGNGKGVRCLFNGFISVTGLGSLPWRRRLDRLRPVRSWGLWSPSPCWSWRSGGSNCSPEKTPEPAESRKEKNINVIMLMIKKKWSLHTWGNSPPVEKLLRWNVPTWWPHWFPGFFEWNLMETKDPNNTFRYKSKF